MIIGVDIDNVIADTEKRLREVLAGRWGISISREDITNYQLDSVPAITPDALAGLYEMFAEGGIFEELDVIAGAAETLGLLAERHRVVLVTSRPERVRPHTERWLAGNGIAFHELIFAERSKVNGVPYELFIEDQENFARELAESGAFVLLFDAPWNRHVTHVNMDRVRGWDDVHRFCFPPCALGH